MKVRKQASELNAQDLQKHPIWEYALDEAGTLGQDEATVRPLAELPLNLEARSQILLAALFRFVDGTLAHGIVSCPTSIEWDMADLRPSILVDDGFVTFWLGVRIPQPDQLTHAYRRLGKNTDQVFPVQLKSLVEVDGTHLQGVLNGFYHYDWEPGKRMYPFKKYLNLKISL